VNSEPGRTEFKICIPLKQNHEVQKEVTTTKSS
jgi:hypothetical protein